MRGIFAVLLAVVAVTCFAEATNNTVPFAAERLVWADDFDTLDPSKWKHFITAWDGGNREFQYYRDNRKNSYVKDGKLYITPTFTSDEMPDLERGRIEEAACNHIPCAAVGGPEDIVNPVYSARLFSRFRYSFNYGRVQIRAKLPRGDWLWPAVWMMPEEEIFGDWPRSGEIDIIESRGNDDLKSPEGYSHGSNVVGSALHFGPSWESRASVTGTYQTPTGSFSDGFHDYEFNWTADQMKFTVDGKVISEVNIPAGGFTQLGNSNHDVYRGKNKNTPFDQKFHFVLNVAVGGNFFDPSWTSRGVLRPWSTWGDSKRQFWNARGTWMNTWGTPEERSLQIDYIRVFQNN